MKEFDDYINSIEPYGGRTHTHSGFVKAKLAKMVVQDTNNPTPEKSRSQRGGFRRSMSHV